MRKWFRMKMIMEFFRSMAKKGMLFFYQLGLVSIAGWTIASLIMAYREVLTNPLQLLAVTEFTNLENGWFVALMTNIVTSDANRIIGRGLVALVIWILLFLFVPLATSSLKSFRLFQFEIELEDEDQLEEQVPVEIFQYARIKIISNIYGEQNKMSLYRFYQEQTGRADYKEALAYYLEMLAGEYMEQVGIRINWGMYEWKSLPDEWKQQAYLSIDKDKPCIKNKQTVCGISKNSLIYTYQHYDTVLVTVLWSYAHEFDAIDQQCIYILHQALSDRLENIEYAFWIKNKAAGGTCYEIDCEIMER